MFSAAPAHLRRRPSQSGYRVSWAIGRRRLTLSLSRGNIPGMKASRLVAGTLGSLSVAAAMALGAAAPAQADTDTNFANELHTFGLYGQKDYNAWIGKIVCKRMRTGLDADNVEAATFVRNNMHNATQEQSWQFLASAMKYYCPDRLPTLLPAERPA